MVACASVLTADGYATRVWMAVRAIRAVQGRGASSPIVISFESVRGLRDRDKVMRAKKRALELGARLFLFPLLPKKLPRAFQLNLAWCAAVIRVLCRLYRTNIIHAQSHAAAGATAQAVRNDRARQMVFDVHGVDIEERLADGRLVEGSVEHRQRRTAEQKAVRRANYILAVTKPLAERMAALASQARRRVRIVPCVLNLECAVGTRDSFRQATRAQLGIGSAPCVLYLGSASAWQQPRLILELFSELQNSMPDAILLIVTGDVDFFANMSRACGIPSSRLRIVTSSHSEVSRYIACGDVGLLLREATIVNRVASPTKFAEYLSMGVPVVVSDVLEDCAAIVSKYRVGVTVGCEEVTSSVAASVASLLRLSVSDREAMAQRCEAAVHEAMSFETVLPVYRELYAPCTTPADGGWAT